jgi:hypothetical protein
VTFSGAAFRSTAFTVDGSGNLLANHLTAGNGLSLGSNVAGGITDLSKHVSLYYDPGGGGDIYGFNVTGGFINYVVPASSAHAFIVNGVNVGAIGASGLNGCVIGALTPAAAAISTLTVDPNGLSFVGHVGASNTDLSKHISLHNAGFGFGVTTARLNYVVPSGSAHMFSVAGVDRLAVTGAGLGFNGTAAITKPTVSGSKGANAALASLLTALASYGLVTDSST